MKSLPLPTTVMPLKKLNGGSHFGVLTGM